MNNDRNHTSTLLVQASPEAKAVMRRYRRTMDIGICWSGRKKVASEPLLKMRSGIITRGSKKRKGQIQNHAHDLPVVSQ